MPEHGKMTSAGAILLFLASHLVGSSHAWFVVGQRGASADVAVDGGSRLRQTARSVSSSPSDGAAAASLTPDDDDDDAEVDEAGFLETCERLCAERNLPLQKVKNCRDLATVRNSPIRPNRILRMGRLSDATDRDIDVLLRQVNLTTIVDLRSPTELKDDETLFRSKVFANFTNLVWKEQGRGKDGCLKELPPNESPVKQRGRFWKRSNGHNHQKHQASDEAGDAEALHPADPRDMLGEEFCIPCSEDPQASPALELPSGDRKERYFVSMMNEFKYVKGTVSKLRKRDISKAILKSPGALVSRRVRTSIKKPFLDEINDGGLPMLNELLLRFGAPGIKYVLELCSDRHRHPIAFHCTAGKDRTGILAAIILKLCGVQDRDIIEDYSLSANVYAEMNDHKAMVGALSQRNLDPKTFLGAPPHVMKEILLSIDEEYGSVEEYCDWIGFGREKQKALIEACTQE